MYEVKEFAGIDLAEHIIPVEELSNANKERLGELITSTEETLMNVEELPLKLLKIKQRGYPEMDPSFLSRASTVPWRGDEIHLPQFGVFRRTKDGFGKFSVEVNTSCRNLIKINVLNVPNILGAPLSQCFGLRGEKWGREFRVEEATYWDFCKRYSGVQGKSGATKMQFNTEFLGIIPPETKTKIAKAEDVFGDKIYLISEVDPSAWTCKKIIEDPLIVGILEGTVYLIDHFDTTAVEDYVRKEFTIDQD